MARRPWGSGTIEQRGPNTWFIRWSQGTDPFTGKQMRRAETLHGVTKAEAQRILNQRIEAAREARETLITCPRCGATFPRPY